MKLNPAYRLTRLNEHIGNSVVATALGLFVNHGLERAPLIPVILLINILLNVFSFAINDIEDAEDDAKDPKKAKRNPISAKDMKLTDAWILTWGCALLALGLALPLGGVVFAIALLTVVLGFLYSYKGFRLKSMPVVDIVSHGLFLGTLPFLVAALAGTGSWNMMIGILATLIFLVSAMGDIDNEIRDYKVDREQKINNTAALIDLRPLAPFVHVLHSLLALAIMVVIASSLSLMGFGMLVLLGVLVGTGYLLTKAAERTKFYYRYAQLLLSAVGVVLLIERWVPISIFIFK